jgi:restriction system protein
MAEMPPNSGEDWSFDSLIQHWRRRDTLSVPLREEARINDGITTRLVRSEGVPVESAPTPGILIQAAIVVFGDKRNEGPLIEGVAIPWFEILREISRDPNFLFRVPWRKLEELIAGAYKREGWPEVVLTPRSGDKGRDVIATKPGIGSIRLIDQVKAYAPDHKVPASDVRELVGVMALDQNVSKGIVTTTSTFAPGVEDEVKALLPYRLELKNGKVLHEWLTGLMNKG